MIYEFSNEIYPRKLWITFDATQEDLTEYFLLDTIPKAINRKVSNGSASGIIGRKETNDAGVLIQLANKNIPLEIISHEAVHAALEMVADISNETIRYENQEWFAYLVEWIVRKVIEARNIKNNN